MIEEARKIAKKMVRRLGGEVEAIYLFGSMAQGFYQPEESDINLLAIVNDGTSIHALRSLYRPIWEENGRLLKRGPMIAQRSDFARHIRLFPLFAHHLKRDGQLLFGDPDHLNTLPKLNILDAYSRLAYLAMEASSALAPELMDEEKAANAQAKLRRLARQVKGAPVPENETPQQLLAHIQHIITPRVQQLPAVQQWDVHHMPTTTSPLLPGLQAIYKEGEYMLLVFSQLSPQTIIRTNWQLLAERLSGQCKGLKITTSEQLCLIYAYERPLDFRFRRLQFSWGVDLVSALQIADRQAILQSARQPSDIQINALPHSYLTEPDDKIHAIIHDYQNKLLNVQLEHELLVRFGLTTPFTPPEPLPDRSAPHQKRIDAILKHLGWWADYYAEQLRRYKTGIL